MTRKLSAGLVALATGATLTGMTGSAQAAIPTGTETTPTRCPASCTTTTGP
ncbi:hypothetical protein ABZX95_27045 [Streptomyces sp. NPDC004232]|uniref:hypothetical protein n=1 Tax=Streptomyces sp. NPDC004232 TaxID=3154454 RepID=UPI001E102DB6|nr:hypothetical protein [Streptomyces sp. tea 10]